MKVFFFLRISKSSKRSSQETWTHHIIKKKLPIISDCTRFGELKRILKNVKEFFLEILERIFNNPEEKKWQRLECN